MNLSNYCQCTVMRISQQKDFSGTTDEAGHYLSSSGKGEWSLEGTQRDIFMDPENKEHQDWLRNWCKAHWLSTFKRSLVYGNKLTYHCCCNCFSRRRFSKAAGHPPLLSIGVLQIPGLRNATSYEDLYNWLLEILRESTRQKRKSALSQFESHTHRQTRLRRRARD